MRILFVDKKTGEEAQLSEDCTEFVINSCGEVNEVLEQHFSNFFGLMGRSDVVAVPDEGIIHVREVLEDE